jgi:hypothetical protein
MAIAHLVFKGGSGLGRGANWHSLWVQDTGDGVPADMEDVISAINTQFINNMQAFVNSNYTIGRVDWTYYPDLLEDPYPTQVFTFTPIAGEEISSPLASRITMLCEFKSFATSGPTRKRVYLGCYGEANNNTSGNPESDLIAAYQAWADDMLGEFNVNGHAWFGYMCRLDPTTHQITHANRLTSHLIQTKWAYLRTRDSGHGI